MEKNESMKKRCHVVLPEGKFGDEFTCCEYCTYNDDERDHILWGEQVKCLLDGEWHDAKHVCKKFMEM